MAAFFIGEDMKDTVFSEHFYNLIKDEKIVESLEIVIKELIQGAKVFDKEKKYITIFGSARIKENTEDYNYIMSIGEEAVKAGFSVVTGGGPGAMEAAAKGAFNAGGTTYGINVALPHEQGTNPYITKAFLCKYLFTRKVLLTHKSSGFVVVPGGFGTLDELFEVLTLMATTLSDFLPVILAGSSFWTPMYDWLKNQMLNKGFISQNELDFIKILDDPAEIIEVISKSSS